MRARRQRRLAAFASSALVAGAIGLALGAGLLVSGPLGAQAAADDAAAVAADAGRPEAAKPVPPWKGMENEIEAALAQGVVTDKKPIGHGVTNPWKIAMVDHGHELAGVFKPLSEGDVNGHHESYRAEVAAYRLSRHLGLDMVPPTVVRTIDGRPGSLQLWLDGVELFEDVKRGAKPPAQSWSEQYSRMRFFDALIENPDRNSGNFLVDADWNIFLIDHSRSLALDQPVRGMLHAPLPDRYDRQLLERARALTMDELDSFLGDLFSRVELGTLLRQRDRVVKAADKALKQRGEGVLFGEAATAGER